MAGVPSAPLHQARPNVPDKVLSGTASSAATAYARNQPTSWRCLGIAADFTGAHPVEMFHCNVYRKITCLRICLHIAEFA